MEAAAQLMYEQGVRATSLEAILDAAGAGKSQLYHYFEGKDDLAGAVLEYQLIQVLGQQGDFRLDTWSGLRSWFGALVAGHESRGYNGCPFGSLAVEMSGMSEELRVFVAELFDRWHASLEGGFEEMRRRGLITRTAVAAELAQATLIAIQGGYLMSSAKRDSKPMEQSLRLALRHLRSFARTPSSGP